MTRFGHSGIFVDGFFFHFVYLIYNQIFEMPKHINRSTCKLKRNTAPGWDIGSGENTKGKVVTNERQFPIVVSK